MKHSILIAGAAVAALLCGCAGPRAREVQLDQQAMSAAIEPQDVRRTIEKMVDSMLEDRASQGTSTSSSTSFFTRIPFAAGISVGEGR